MNRVIQVLGDFLLLVLVVLGPALFNGVVQPVQRGFYCDDQSIQYPYKSSTVSDVLLYVIALLIPLILLIIGEVIRIKLLHVHTSTRETLASALYKLGLVFIFGAAVTHFITDMAKISVGRLRPHFLAVCVPDTARYNCSDGYITADVCTGNNHDRIREARMSFPSGHASLTMYAMLFLMIYIRSRVTWSALYLLKSFLLAGCFVVGVYVSLTRIFDYKHHPWDVAVGAVLGSLVAIIISTRVAGLGLGSSVSSAPVSRVKSSEQRGHINTALEYDTPPDNIDNNTDTHGRDVNVIA